MSLTCVPSVTPVVPKLVPHWMTKSLLYFTIKALPEELPVNPPATPDLSKNELLVHVPTT